MKIKHFIWPIAIIILAVLAYALYGSVAKLNL